MRISKQQVFEQQTKFDNLLNKINLPRLGEKLVKLQIYQDGWANKANFSNRILKINGVGGAFIHPVSLKFYGEILEQMAIMSFADALSKENNLS